MEGESVKWNEASGRISLEYVYLYPPGIPMIVPGERITSTIVQKMVKYKEMGFSIEGLSQENCLLVGKKCFREGYDLQRIDRKDAPISFNRSIYNTSNA